MANIYKVLVASGLSLPAGRAVKLDAHQLERRKHQVRPAPDLDGFYVSAERLTFKLGEEIEVDGELPKNLAALTDQPAPASKPTPVKVDPGRPARNRRDR